MNKAIRLSFLSALLAASAAYAGDLPPDPGEAGMWTLAGIDFDHDGVRDDVQRWIALTFPDSQKTREALFQKTKTMQQFLLNADDPVAAHNTFIRMSKDSRCLAYIYPTGFSKVTSEHKAMFLNTRLRSKTWLQASNHLSGHMFKGLDYKDWKKGCDFDPDAMPN